MELLDKLQKQIFRTGGPSPAASLEFLAYHRNVTSLRLLYRYYSGRCSSELAELFSLLNSLPIGCFPVTYNLNVFKSGISRHL